ncbi:MAG: DUF433 domain-containing protein [Crocosphaera sp.]|nr:DUF433 domain-containing protein [Crocosphaera sp.]
MTLTSNEQSVIIRTERGLTIAGTGITLYDVMDYITEQYPPKFICAMLSITDEQLISALSYIDDHRAEVEIEYQNVLKEAEELQQYYEQENHDLIAKITTKPPEPTTEEIRAKLRAERAKFESQI